MKDRIYTIMKDSGMNQKEFSQATGIATATLSNIFNGRTSATLNHAKAIHQHFPDIRIEWLIFGEGEMRAVEGSQGAGASAPTLFDLAPAAAGGRTQPQPLKPAAGIGVETVLETMKEAVREMQKPRRSVVEIRVFFDDGTYDVFQANRQP
ncbi:MAG: helix-turn-helix domain-containing protein [Prevotellaceae bacterium]|nr:helix-turn-helix domain-containing protein [Prevotellaceae bacterium]